MTPSSPYWDIWSKASIAALIFVLSKYPEDDAVSITFSACRETFLFGLFVLFQESVDK